MLRRAAAATRTRLYVLLRGDWRQVSTAQAYERLLFVYDSLAQSHPRLDVRVLLPPAESASSAAAVEPGATGLPTPGSAAVTANVCGALAMPCGAPELQALLGATEDDGEDIALINAGRSAAGLGPLLFFLLPPKPTDTPEPVFSFSADKHGTAAGAAAGGGDASAA